MSKSETMLAFEAALKENKELREKFAAAGDSEVLVKAAAEMGFALSLAEVERVLAQEQEVNEEELTAVAGGNWIDGELVNKPFVCTNTLVGMEDLYEDGSKVDPFTDFPDLASQN